MVANSDIIETAEIASDILNYPLSVKRTMYGYELISGTDKLIKVHTEEEIFRVLQGMILAKQYKAIFTKERK